MTKISHRLIHTSSRETSAKAKATVWQHRETIRQRVEAYFLAHPFGRTDDELRRDVDDYYIGEGLSPPPESSYRKRRTELSEENILVTDGTTRKNEHGQDSLVWFHRDSVLNPPPLKPRAKKLTRLDQLREDNALLRSQNDALLETVAMLREHLAARKGRTDERA